MTTLATVGLLPGRPALLERAASYRVLERKPSRGGTGRSGAEAVLQAAWRRLGPGATVPGRDGLFYTIVYPGRPADGPGPDFRDAVLRGPDGVLRRGDVEIHVRASGWRAHGHHRDPGYNGVAFHVTAEDSSGGSGGSGSVRTVSGRYIHLLTLRQPGSSDAGPESFTSLESPKSPGSGESDRHLAPPEHMEPPASGRSNGAVGHVSPDATTPLSDPAAAGDQRFFGKSAGYSIALREYGGDAAAWSAVLDCLGYSRNRRAFRQVALRLPWPVAQRAMECGGDASPLLRWAGGLGPKPRQLRGLRASAASPDWVLGGRPDNRPERRLDAAAVFARRWRERGPLDDIISAVRTAAGPKELIGRFLVAANSPGGRSLVGPGRAGEIVVNAVLPVVHAWSLIADRRDVGEKALQLYRDHPKLPENAITREMTALLAKSGGAPDIRGAREQQGLILMYRNMTAGSLFARPPQ